MTAALFVLATVSALRGAWSPCGLSMLSTITPIAERARGHRYGWTAAWFLVGATLGGVTLGAAMACATLVSRAVGVTGTAPVVAAVVTIVVCLAADLRIFGLRLPERPRQVDATWVTRLRPWAYAGGFGWQLGTGVSTYVMTNATYAVILVGIVAVAPATALELGVVYGVCRGATILAGVHATSPPRLSTLHRRLAATDRASVAVTVAVQLGVLAVFVAQLGSGAIVSSGAVCAAALLVAGARRRRAPSSSRVPVGAP